MLERDFHECPVSRHFLTLLLVLIGSATATADALANDRDALADEGRGQRLPLYDHIPESVRLETAVAAGHRSVEHFGRARQA